MRIFNIFFFYFLTLVSQLAWALEVDELLPPEQAFKVTARAVTSNQIEISWDIADGYYLYLKKMRCESKSPDVQLATPDYPAGKIKHDETFGEVTTYRDNLKVPIFLKTSNGAASVELMGHYQGCTD